MLTSEQATFIQAAAKENDMTYDQLVQYIVDDFLRQLYRKGYKYKSAALTEMLRQYIYSDRFKRIRRKYQNAGPSRT